MKIAATLKNAANTIACCGFSTPVETTVAIEFAASWKPFMKSKATASATSDATTQKPTWIVFIAARGDGARRPSRVLQDHAFDQVGDVLAAVRDRLERLVDRLQLDQLAHVVLLAEQLGHRGPHHAVGVRLEAVDLLAGLDRRLGGRRLADARQQGHRMLHPLAAARAD